MVGSFLTLSVVLWSLPLAENFSVDVSLSILGSIPT